MAEAHFTIDGSECPIPGLESFNMDEAEILYECCGLTLEDFAIDDEDPDEVAEMQQKTRHPGFVRALMIVAYMRDHPGIPKKKAASVIGRSNIVDAYMAFAQAGGEEDPTEAQSSNPTSESSSGNGSGSGESSTKSSDDQERRPESTGTSA